MWSTFASLWRARTARALAAAALQAALMAALLGAYGYARHLVDGRFDTAFEHARFLWNFERELGLPDEAALQRAALDWSLRWVWPANQYYVRVHFPASILFMIWVYLRHRRAWPRIRAAIPLSAALALVIHALYPLAPPRLLPSPDMGDMMMLDLMTVYGPSAYATEPGEGMANQFAAMPSLHVGWAVLIAWGIIRYGRTRWRYLAVLHPVVTLLVVVLTANHYWLDGAVGVAVVVVALVATFWLERPPAPARPEMSVPRDSVGA
ncbi:phosphatase PAP2 family protein [Actinomadura hibisca]|uniref:phosphatase PAP2 family protein n=1 Tax=Actinomadura hibisca TaxID=68565 RepID=UPI00082E5EE4|nr:phosphatase PAP2 family protein [Actinomadura hibisca]